MISEQYAGGPENAVFLLENNDPDGSIKDSSRNVLAGDFCSLSFSSNQVRDLDERNVGRDRLSDRR